MARFLKIQASIHGYQANLQTPGLITRFINVYDIEEITGKPKLDNQDQPTGKYEITICLHASSTTAGSLALHYNVEESDVDAEGFTAIVEKMIAEDRQATPAPAPEPKPAPAPVRLGYAFTETNTSTLAVDVADIDDYDEIEFTGRAAVSAKAALALSEPFSVKVARSDIPINTSPASAPNLVLTVPEADNIKVGRSADGQTLYLIGQDDVRAFGIEIIGHKAA